MHLFKFQFVYMQFLFALSCKEQFRENLTMSHPKLLSRIRSGLQSGFRFSITVEQKSRVYASFQVSVCVYAISFSLPCKEQFGENLTTRPQLYAPCTAETQFLLRQIPNPSSSLLRYPERERGMASALRSAMLRHIRMPVTEALTLNGSKWNLFNNVRSMSSHDDHITKEEVIHRVLDVVKSFPKVDPSKVRHSHSTLPLSFSSLDLLLFGC